MFAMSTDALPHNDDAWAFEMKWDGMRALVTVERGRVHAVSRQGNDATARFPELEDLADTFADRDVVLDGEIVALDAGGRPSFERLQPRMQAASGAAVRRGTEVTPVVLLLFDVLWLDGRSVMPRPYAERRRVLEQLEIAGPSFQTPPATFGHGQAAYAAAGRL